MLHNASIDMLLPLLSQSGNKGVLRCALNLDCFCVSCAFVVFWTFFIKYVVEGSMPLGLSNCRLINIHVLFRTKLLGGLNALPPS